MQKTNLNDNTHKLKYIIIPHRIVPIPKIDIFSFETNIVSVNLLTVAAIVILLNYYPYKNKKCRRIIQPNFSCCAFDKKKILDFRNCWGENNFVPRLKYTCFFLM